MADKIIRSSNPYPTARLGPLEQQLLQELWSCQTATVRELLENCKLDLAYTTVMTTLDRLFKKGLLERAPEGRAFRYSPRHTREGLQKFTAMQGLRSLLRLNTPSSLPLSYIVDAVGETDIALLDELQSLVESKRRALRKGEKR